MFGPVSLSSFIVVIFYVFKKNVCEYYFRIFKFFIHLKVPFKDEIKIKL